MVLLFLRIASLSYATLNTWSLVNKIHPGFSSWPQVKCICYSHKFEQVKKILYRIRFGEKFLLKISLIYVYNLYFSCHSCGGGYKHCLGECLCCRWGVCVVLVVLVQSVALSLRFLFCFCFLFSNMSSFPLDISIMSSFLSGIWMINSFLLDFWIISRCLLVFWGISSSSFDTEAAVSVWPLRHHQ